MSRARRLLSGTLCVGGVALSLHACSTEPPTEYWAAGGSKGAVGGSSGNGRSGASAGGRAEQPPAEAMGGGGTEEPGQASAAGNGGESQGPIEDGCGAAPVSTSAFTLAALRSAAAECAGWQYCRFETSARQMQEAVESHATLRTAASLETARAAWLEAMSLWSEVELFQFGPLGSKSEAAGRDPYHGEGIRDLIYAWPAVGRCKVEDQVIGRGYASSWSTVVISGRGLFGLEYLLFYPGSDTACPASSSTSKVWATLSEAELQTRKLEYATALSHDVSERAVALRQAWLPSGGDFASTFVSAAGYPSGQEAMNVLAWSLVYVERELKDWKLGVPAGYTLTHPVSTPEAPYARVAIDNIRGNLRGFRSLFEGCGPAGEGLGFDDWLIKAEKEELARDMLLALRAAQAAADAFPRLDAATAEEIDSLYLAIKALTNLLKAELFGAGSALNLKLPAGVEGDTD
ncbi:MAG TPA: imelysin family protein [Polyangiaceae bacterium]|nr:imelysin family protein [Polyangiaceae bacterium]